MVRMFLNILNGSKLFETVPKCVYSRLATPLSESAFWVENPFRPNARNPAGLVRSLITFDLFRSAELLLRIFRVQMIDFNALTIARMLKLYFSLHFGLHFGLHSVCTWLTLELHLSNCFLARMLSVCCRVLVSFFAS